MADPFQTALQHHHAGRLAEAEALYRRILRNNPQHAEALHHLGLIAHRAGHLQAAAELIERSLRLAPRDSDGRFNLSLVLIQFASAMSTNGEIDGSIVALSRAIAVRPDFAEAHSDLANVLTEAGENDRAIDEYRSALRINPDLHGAHSNLIFTLHYLAGVNPDLIREETSRWNKRFARTLPARPDLLINSVNRRLRVGYVSGDLREHPVGRFLEPLLANHDKGRFEIFAYANSPISDAWTAHLQSSVEHWNRVDNWTDAQLVEAIRRDQIDILVDLSLHSHGNRLLAFAQRPAPVQVSWLGYPGSSGLDAIGFWLSDPFLTPVGDDPPIGGRVVRLAKTYWCYQPHPSTGPISALPAMQQGHVTFGCLNNFSKVNDVVIDAWILILRAVPGSRLIVHLKSKSARQKLVQRFQSAGIESSRVEFVGLIPAADYFNLHNKIDIVLDPFPFNGGATTCDALWMGVPVISLAGSRPSARSGLSILSNIGLTELAVDSVDAYVQCAAGLANDSSRLQRLRSNLRDRMFNSPLMNAAEFARDFESALESMLKEILVA